MINITATELPRVLTCNGSRLLTVKTPSANAENPVKDEGNAADWLIKEVSLGNRTAEEYVDRKAENGVYITSEMVDHLGDYFEWVKTGGEIERDCSYHGDTWRVNGRADHVKYDPNTLYISDFKYGWKPVEVFENWTLISHAVGWVMENGVAPENIEFRIYQPRPYHPDGKIRKWNITYDQFYTYWSKLIGILNNLNDTLTTSKHCYKCVKAPTCPAHQLATMNAIDVSTKAFDNEPNNEELEFLINETSNAIDILTTAKNAYEDLALGRLKRGSHFKNYSIQTDYGRETWNEGLTPEIVEMFTGVNVSKKALKTPKQVIALGVPEEMIKTLIYTPNKGIKLVKRSSSDYAAKLLNRK